MFVVVVVVVVVVVFSTVAGSVQMSHFKLVNCYVVGTAPRTITAMTDATSSDTTTMTPGSIVYCY